MLIIMATLQPDYVIPFLSDPRGRVMLLGAGVMELAGVIILRRLGDVQV
jgi:Flp pilus assembly protein TadB